MAALVVEGRVLGTVVVGDRLGRGRTFDEGDRMLLDALAAQVGVTVERVRFDERLNQQAFHDALTGLANRSLFADRVAHALERRVPHGRYRAAVLFIDLDDFKVVNDSLGHPSGDLLLQAVTQRLRRVVRPFDTVARWGGDEFAVLLEDVAGPEEPLAVAERFLEELRVAFDLNGTGVTMGASIGIAIANSSITSPDDLLRQADVAMYRAKERGKATVETFEPSMQSALESRVQLTGELERGLAAGEVSVEYQPIVALGSGVVVGVEALARWDSPRRGRVAPREFIPVAEASGLIRDLGEQVLRTACLQARRWMQEHPGQDFSVSVNLSPRQLLHAGFADTVGDVLRDTGLPPSRLTLEITESLLVEKTPATLRRLKALKDLGVTLAIDDFGTGYSSLAELSSSPSTPSRSPNRSSTTWPPTPESGLSSPASSVWVEPSTCAWWWSVWSAPSSAASSSCSAATWPRAFTSRPRSTPTGSPTCWPARRARRRRLIRPLSLRSRGPSPGSLGPELGRIPR